MQCCSVRRRCCFVAADQFLTFGLIQSLEQQLNLLRQPLCDMASTEVSEEAMRSAAVCSQCCVPVFACLLCLNVCALLSSSRCVVNVMGAMASSAASATIESFAKRAGFDWREGGRSDRVGLARRKQSEDHRAHRTAHRAKPCPLIRAPRAQPSASLRPSAVDVNKVSLERWRCARYIATRVCSVLNCFLCMSIASVVLQRSMSALSLEGA